MQQSRALYCVLFNFGFFPRNELNSSALSLLRHSYLCCLEGFLLYLAQPQDPFNKNENNSTNFITNQKAKSNVFNQPKIYSPIPSSLMPRMYISIADSNGALAKEIIKRPHQTSAQKSFDNIYKGFVNKTIVKQYFQRFHISLLAHHPIALLSSSLRKFE